MKVVIVAFKMPLLAMFVARAMMIVALVGSVSMYFYLHILRNSPLFRSRQDAYVPPPPFQWDRADRRNVIIVTNSAFDSNILGKLFNQHPGVFYMEQPLYPFEIFKTLNYTHQSEYSGQVRAFLDNLFHCRFHGYKDYLTFLSHPGLASPKYRLASKALSSPPLCREEVSVYTSKFLELCPFLHPKWVSNVCASKMHVVVSIFGTRAPAGGLVGLLPLMTSESMATRISYLVKDPRASLWDTMGQQGSLVGSGNTIYETKIQDFCLKLEKEIDFFESLPRELNKQYQIVRYEELLQNISSAAEKAFKFAEIKQVPSVRDFAKSEQNKLTNIDHESSWRLAIDRETISMVEKHCARVMRTLGYKILHDDVDILRNLRDSLLTMPQTSQILKK